MLVVTKLFRVVLYQEELPTINLHDTSVGWSPLAEGLAHQTREGDDLLERLLLLKPHNALITGSTRGHTTISKIVISLFTKFMATKLGMMLTS